MTKKVANMGLMIALAFIFSYIESLFPIAVGVPGVKLGLANLVSIVALYAIGTRAACEITLIRVVLVGLTFGNLASMAYSLAGGILSLAVMVIAKKKDCFSVRGVSVLGGVFHNVGQIALAMVLLETRTLIYYLPVLAVSGVVAGVLIGILGDVMIKRLRKIQWM